MEHNDPSRRPYETYAPQQSQQSQQRTRQTAGQYGQPGSVERFRQHPAYQQQSPTEAPASARSGPSQQMYAVAPNAQYGAQSSMQPNPLQYAQDTQSQEPQRQQQPSVYPQYNANFMYGMGQPQAQTQQSTQGSYEQVAPYRPRRDTASETIPTQFGVPQTAQYYLGSQALPTSGPASEFTAPHIQAQYPPSAYAQQTPPTPRTYPGVMMHPSQAGPYAPYAQQPQAGLQHPVPAGDQNLNEFWQRVRSIFSIVQEGALRDIGVQLLGLTHYLLGNVEAHGLTRDEEDQHDERIRIWDNFNRAWLVTLQRQFDMTEQMVATGQSPRQPQSIMSQAALERLGRELVRMCDSIERHGLVDYQMGVAEEEIMDRCFYDAWEFWTRQQKKAVGRTLRSNLHRQLLHAVDDNA